MGRRVKKTDQGKAWNKKLTKRKPPHIETKSKAKSFYIVCEGVNTEPEYFKSFPLGNAQVESFGLGQSKTKLVESVIELLASDESIKEKEVWVVFDMDINHEQGSQQKEDYNKAIDSGRKLHDKQAHLNFSDKNPCTTVFELVQELNQYL